MAIHTAVGRTSSAALREPPLPADDVISQSIRLVRGAYLEIPTLHLTRSQVQRLWDLDAGSCDRTLEALLEWRFLEPTADGAFVRGAGGR